MRSLAYLSLALAASLTTALPASAQDETSGTEQTTGAADQTTEDAGAQDAGQTATEPGTDAAAGETTGQADTEQGADASAAQSTDQADSTESGPSGEIRPLTITCQDIVDTDVQLVPQLVYWIDGYNIAYDAVTGQTDVDPVVSVAQNWLTVPVENIIRACEANPASTAAEVIAQERASNEGAASQ